MITSHRSISVAFSFSLDAFATRQTAANVRESVARTRLPHPYRNPGIHVPVPDDGAARLRDARARLRPGSAVHRAEGAEAVRLVVPQRGRLPRGGDEPDRRRPRARAAATLPAPDGALQRPRRNLHDRRGRASQARLAAGARRSAQRAAPGAAAGRRMNPRLARLQPYPFEKLRLLTQEGSRSNLAPINLSI